MAAITGNKTLRASALVALFFLANDSAPAQSGSPTGADVRSSSPADRSYDEARAELESRLRQLRSQHRAAIERMADAWETALKDVDPAGAKGETPATIDASRKLLATLRAACDAQSAMQLILQVRSRLSGRGQQLADGMVQRLATLVSQEQEAKRTYQPYLAQSLRRRWDALAIPEKRIALHEYFSFGGEVPEWLFQGKRKSTLPLERATADKFKSFEGKEAQRLRTAERQFQPRRDALVPQLQSAHRAASTTADQRSAVKRLLRLLEADYGKGFRGMMLVQPDAELPANLHSAVAELCTDFRTQLASLRSQHATALAELEQSLAPVRHSHLSSSAFARLMAIDLTLHELRQLLRPMRIRAYRDPGTDWPEEAWLLDVDDSRYRVRFLLDQQEAWLPSQQVLLSPTAKTRPEFSEPVPMVGPGAAVTDRTSFQIGQTVMGYRNQTWYPATVVDLSPLGISITWQGFNEDTSQLEPRHNLRLLHSQPGG